ncbi:hypothetical protein T10_5290 [Trichinella papuae]|uniref:Uncharacterized protein n=1 Tax=Trichinella papuae TaxID=268474 RepID=A0A0V1M6F0_9BILA|nr:hypothetical protein T10_5290 [Trichinella papuae]
MITETKADWLLLKIHRCNNDGISICMCIREISFNEEKICELIVDMLRKSFFVAGSRAVSQSSALLCWLSYIKSAMA